VIVVPRHLERPSHGIIRRLDGRRHAQHLAPLGGGTLHLHIAGHAL
jgi:hypothetical protein